MVGAGGVNATKTASLSKRRGGGDLELRFELFFDISLKIITKINFFDSEYVPNWMKLEQTVR